MLALALALLFPPPSPAYTPSPELFSSPALLVDYAAWSKREDTFNAPGSETRAFRELVEILYDRTSSRPWGDGYFPEANRRLTQFRALTCSCQPTLSACLLPATLATDADVAALEANLAEASSLAELGERFSLAIAPWSPPLREPAFSLLAGPLAGKEVETTGFWDLRADSVSWTIIGQQNVGDFENYVAAFNGDSFPSLYALQGPNSAALDDWRLRDRAMDFASRWKHIIWSNRGLMPKNPVAEAKELQLQKMFDEQAGEFAATYAGQLSIVQTSPEVLARFKKERAAGDYPEETYQHVAYRELRALAIQQGSYLALAAEQRKNTSARQQALESLLTVQHYGENPRLVALELTTRMTPLSSDASVIDEVADFTLAQVYVLEQLKALLGMEAYEGTTLFPTLGRSLLAPELFNEDYLTENAPEVKTALAGRDFAGLAADEQLRILRLYLLQPDGKVRPTGLFRLAAVLLTGTNADELHALAARVHEVRKGNFR